MYIVFVKRNKQNFNLTIIALHDSCAKTVLVSNYDGPKSVKEGRKYFNDNFLLDYHFPHSVGVRVPSGQFESPHLGCHQWMQPGRLQ